MTTPRRRATNLVLVGILAVGGLLASGAGTAAASCVGPRLSVAPGAARIGESVEVRGTGFGTACNDTFDADSGPPDQETVLGDPDPQIQLRVVQHGLSIPLARLGANNDYKFVVRVTVPGGMEPGPASIEATTSFVAPVPVAIQVQARVGPPVDEPPPTVVSGTTYGIERGHADDRTGWIVAAAGLLAVVGVSAVVIIRRRRAADLSRG